MAAKKTGNKGRAKVDPSETAEQRFVRLAVKRTNKALNDIRLIGNLARYSHTTEQGEAVISAIRDAGYDLSEKFNATSKAAKPTFSL